MKYFIKYEELSEYLQTLKESDFQRADGHPARNPDGIMKCGFGIDDIERFNKDISEIPPKQIIHYGMPFLVDIIGNDLSVVIMTRRKYKSPNGRVVKAKFDTTVVSNCNKTYGTPLNGYWMIPDEFITKVK